MQDDTCTPEMVMLQCTLAWTLTQIPSSNGKRPGIFWTQPELLGRVPGSWWLDAAAEASRSMPKLPTAVRMTAVGLMWPTCDSQPTTALQPSAAVRALLPPSRGVRACCHWRPSQNVSLLP